MDTTMLSLFDYLKKPAGKDLGGEVYKESKKKKVKIKVETREINNRVYTGKVMLYPRWFLDEYFKKDDNQEELHFQKQSYAQEHGYDGTGDDDLPF